MTRRRSMISVRTFGTALVAASSLWFVAPQPTVTAAESPAVCSGRVFDDLDLDGHDDDEPGAAAVRVQLTDAAGRSIATVTGTDGVWAVEADRLEWPVRIRFDVPGRRQPSRLGPDNGGAVQFVSHPDECGAGGLGSFAVFEPGAACHPDSPIAVGCFVIGDAEGLDDRPALQLVDADTVDDGSIEVRHPSDWLAPAPATLATHGELGAVYGVATDHRGAVYAASFVKRHTRLRSALNPTGNPTTIYRIVPGEPAEVFVTLDPDATDPHGDAHPDRYRDDAAVFDDVFTTGIGDIEVSPDGSALYAVDLGRRELVVISTVRASVILRVPLDGAALGIDDCAVSDETPFGDLRPFGLGFDTEGDLLVGVVCSAASTVPAETALGRDARQPLGDPSALMGYVYERVAPARLEQRLAWQLDHDRGETQGNGLLSNDARWRPWVPAVPFDDEYDAVSYPQPVVSDIAIDHTGSLIIALADRWGHQTAPDSTAPTVTGARQRITEPVSAGDLQRACPTVRGWVIEGSPGCTGGWGDGFEFYAGDSYGWHAETALGSVVAVPGPDGSDETTLIASQMDPLPQEEPWFSAGLVWHDSASGDYLRGTRLYDGRFADPEITFEHAAGITDLARLCDAAPVEVGGRIWHDLDGDGVQDPDEPPIPGVRVELRTPDGDILTTVASDARGGYAFTADDDTGGLVEGDAYLVTIADWNSSDGPFSDSGRATGLRPTTRAADAGDGLDSDGRVGDDRLPQAGLTYATVVAGDDPATARREPGVDHTVDFGFRDQYDLAVATRWVRHDDMLGVLAFETVIHNQGSEPSGSFEVTTRLPAGTQLVAASAGADGDLSGRELRWRFAGDDELAAGETVRLTVLVHVVDAAQSPFANTIEVTVDDGDDDDSTPANAEFDLVLRRHDAFRPDGSLIDDNGGSGLEDDADVALVYLHRVTGRIWLDPDRDGTYEPDPLAADPTEVEEAAAGVAVVLHHADGTEIERQWTTHDGSYEFTLVPSGSYYVSVPVEEFDDERPLHGHDWMRSAYRTGGFDQDDGLDVPLTLRPGSDRLAQVDIALARRPARSWWWLLGPEVVLPMLVLGAIGMLMIQRRASRAALLAA